MASTSINTGSSGILLPKQLHHRTADVNEVVTVHNEADQDQVDLARAGKRQVLNRNFGLTSMTGFSCALMCTWEGLLVGFVLGFDNGGSAGLVYGLIVTWLGTLSVFTVMGELCSIVPTAGGQYHWVNILAPDSSRRFLSYITGWLTVAGWTSAVATTSFFVATLIVGVVQLNFPEYDTQAWQQTLIFWALLVISVFVNTVASQVLPLLEVFILLLHILGFFAILIPVVYLAPHRSAREVFTVFTNNGGWSTQALSFFVGLQGNANSFIGSDGAVHMSEEVKNATRDVPRSMVISIMINGSLAFGILLAVLFAFDPNDVPTDTLYPFIPILARAVNSNAGASVMAGIVIVMQLCASIGTLAAASRMMWAFARDRGLPGWHRLSRVNQRTTIPLLSIFVAASIAALLGFVNLGSNAAFNDIISLTLEGLFSSYFVAAALLLYRRVRGDIAERDNETIDKALGDGEKKPFTWGVWRVPGLLGTLNNIVACVYLLVISFFSFWPTSTPTSASEMNYSQTVWGSVIIFSIIYYFLSAKKVYNGPIVEVQLVPVPRDSAAL